MSTLSTSTPALTAWRENRGGGRTGMQSVINVLQNRAKARNTSLYAEAVRPMQFTSISPPPNMTAAQSEAAKWPLEGDPDYAVAEQMVIQALAGELPDITGGATNYYSMSMPTPPVWAASMTETVTIEGQIFFK
jgi:hypothetical protein